MKYLYKQCKLISFLLFFSVIGSATANSSLKCNIGIADITPKGPVELAGFAAREGFSIGIHRHIQTHCLVIKNDSDKVCIITNDLMEIPLKEADILRDKIAKESGIDREHIFVHEIHTHSAPRVKNEYAKECLEIIAENAVKTIKDEKDYQSFTLEAGKINCVLNVNRREKNGPCDHEVYVVRFLNKKHKPIVSLVNYACHPVSLSHKSLWISTDFPGITVSELEKKWGGKVFYFTGASGNVDPLGGLKADTSYTQQMGKLLADTIQMIHFTKIKDNKSLKVVNDVVKLPFRSDEITYESVNKLADEISKREISKSWKNDVEAWRIKTCQKITNNEVQNYLPLRIGAVKVGGTVLFFSQGEPFNEYQTILRKSFPGIPILFMGYTNGQSSYLPSKNAFECKGDNYDYEINQMFVYVGTPYPLSDKMPSVYETAIKETVKKVFY